MKKLTQNTERVSRLDLPCWQTKVDTLDEIPELSCSVLIEGDSCEKWQYEEYPHMYNNHQYYLQANNTSSITCDFPLKVLLIKVV